MRPSSDAELPRVLRGRRQLTNGEAFCFRCRPDLECFTRCCADVNILLTPYDVLRLARRLELSTTQFLNRYTMTPITKELQLPLVLLRMEDAPEKQCPFVREGGCTVYEARPWSCRMYPVGMAIPPARAGVEPEPVYFLFEDDHCLGHREDKAWSVACWKQSEGILHQEKLEEGFRRIVSHPWFIGGRQLDPKRIEMFHMACYDLDRFRRFVFESSFLDRFELEESLVAEVNVDDEALLGFAFRWLRFALFGEPTMVARESTKFARSGV